MTAPPSQDPLRSVPTVGDHVTARLAVLVAGCDPGDRLPPERELAVRLGVSRTSVRAGLGQLEDRGLLERRPGRGTTVLPPPAHAGALLSQLAQAAEQATRVESDVAEMRLLVEPRLAALAAERATSADLLALDELLPAAAADAETSLALDTAFHLHLARATGNALLVSLCSSLATLVADVRARSHATDEGRAMSVRDHRLITAAVADRDPVAAAAAMTRHLTAVADLVARTPASTPRGPEAGA